MKVTTKDARIAELEANVARLDAQLRDQMGENLLLRGALQDKV